MYISSDLNTEQNLSILIPDTFSVYKKDLIDAKQSVWYFFAPLEKGYQLLVLYVRESDVLPDYKKLESNLQNHLRANISPEHILFIELVKEGLLKDAKDERSNEGKIKRRRITWSWDIQTINRILDTKLSIEVKKKYPKVKLFGVKFYAFILSLAFAWQGYYLLNDQDLSLVFSINLANWATNKLNLMLGGIFLHSNGTHFILNIFSLYYIGRLIERFLNPIQFFLILLISGYAGALATLNFYTEPLSSIGASGSIFGLIGACLYKFSSNFKDYGAFYDYQAKRIFKLVLILVMANFLLPLFVPKIDIWAHLGGLVAGFILGFLFTAKVHKFRKIWALFCLLIAFWVLHNDANESAKDFSEMVIQMQKDQQSFLAIINSEIIPLTSRLSYELLESNESYQEMPFPFNNQWLPQRTSERELYLKLINKLEELYYLRSLEVEKRRSKANEVFSEFKEIENKLIVLYGLRRVEG